jgi:hypothetical protein
MLWAAPSRRLRRYGAMPTKGESEKTASCRRAAPSLPPRSFQVGVHVVLVALREGRWTLSVDGAPNARWYMTQAAAWEAGVREAYRLDGLQKP